MQLVFEVHNCSIAALAPFRHMHRHHMLLVKTTNYAHVAARPPRPPQMPRKSTSRRAPTTPRPRATWRWSWCASRRPPHSPRLAGERLAPRRCRPHGAGVALGTAHALRLLPAAHNRSSAVLDHTRATVPRHRLGKGDKEAADQAAVDVMRRVMADIKVGAPSQRRPGLWQCSRQPAVRQHAA